MTIFGRKLGATALVVTALSAATAAHAADPAPGNALKGLQAMRETNLIVFENVTGGHDVEGKAYVGGNLTGNSLTIGNGNTKQGAAASNRSTLTVGGTLGAQVNLNNGSNGGSGNVATNYGATVAGSATKFNLNANNATVRVGGAMSGIKVSDGSNVAIGGSIGQMDLGKNSVTTVGGAASNINGAQGAVLKVGGGTSGYVNLNGATITPNQGGGFNAPVITNDLGAETLVLLKDLTKLSSDLTKLAPASNTSYVSYSGSRATFNAFDTGEGYALFNLTDAIFNYGEFDYKFAAGDYTVIFNVKGDGDYTWLANAVGGNTSAANQRVIWNFADATKIDFQRMVHGSVLAPLAAIKNNTPIEGSVVAKSFEQGGEIHLGTYNGGDIFKVTSAVPEPATWAMMILGFFGVGATLRRRRGGAALA